MMCPFLLDQNKIRRMIGLNLILGLVTVAIASGGRYI